MTTPFLLILLLLMKVSGSDASTMDHTHLLFITSDNIRAEFSVYGKSQMITPSIEKLAHQSIIFDNTYAQFSQSTLRHMKELLHLDSKAKNVRQDYSNGKTISDQHEDCGTANVNSTLILDKRKGEIEYSNYHVATEAIESLRKLHASKESRTIFVEFTVSPPCHHIPLKYFDMYRNRSKDVWEISNEERTFPNNSPIQAYQSCSCFNYMNNEEATQYLRSERFQTKNLDFVTPQQMYTENMWGYSAAITFVDKQLGRILDVLDELDLWKNMTIVLTSDHGMHNGEKGICGSETLFDESLRVPLLIHHPTSTAKGTRYSEPVESVDIYPTVRDLRGMSRGGLEVASDSSPRASDNSPRAPTTAPEGFLLPQGVSLAEIVLGNVTGNLASRRKFALSQKLLCSTDHSSLSPSSFASPVDELANMTTMETMEISTMEIDWHSCDLQQVGHFEEAAVMGYSMRTVDYRYTLWLPLDRQHWTPLPSMQPLAQELYDHRGERMGQLGRMETNNVADDPSYKNVVAVYQEMLTVFLKGEISAHKSSRNLQMAEEGETVRKERRKDKKDKKEKKRDRREKGDKSINDINIEIDSATKDSPMQPLSSSPSSLSSPTPKKRHNRKTDRKIVPVPYKNISQTNLLFIMFDDLRPELSIYGKSHMITPNFERLAKRSVVFDHVYAQISVCNPSRDSMLTGLRPDTVGTLNFFTTYDPHLVLPTRLLHSGYRTFAYGKIRHSEGPEVRAETWEDSNDGDWYNYQSYEGSRMNSSVMPDKNSPEESFPDYNFTTMAIETLRKLHAENDAHYMVAVGFKMPHTALHVPFKYFDMYRNHSQSVWELSSKERQYPPSAPVQSWRCCAYPYFKFMHNEGAEKARSGILLDQDIDFVTPQQMYTENMWGYSAAITFVDKQLGRILDVLDELDLWKNMTIVLTSDHGMHNGEKGIWEKWSLFDESTRVPLLVHHPLSPMKGRRYPHLVELIDIFPTVLDLLNPPYDHDSMYTHPGFPRKYVPLQGKSLAPAIFGYAIGNAPRPFALSQALKCALKKFSDVDLRNKTSSNISEADWEYLSREKLWFDCNILDRKSTQEVPLMGYSMRTIGFRYTAWMKLHRSTWSPVWTEPLVAEELYDHRGEALGDLGHLEVTNLARDPKFSSKLAQLRNQLLSYLKNEIIYFELMEKS